MKEKIKVGDIIRYNGTGLFGDDIQINEVQDLDLD